MNMQIRNDAHDLSLNFFLKLNRVLILARNFLRMQHFYAFSSAQQFSVIREDKTAVSR